MLTYTRAHLLDVVAFADPAGPKRAHNALKKTRARMAIVVVGLTPLSHVVVLDAWAERTSTTAFIEKIYDLSTRWTPSVFGIEEAAQQGLFIDATDYIVRHGKGVQLPIAAIRQPPDMTKEYRIRTTIQPLMKAGRLLVRASFTELLSEIRTFPRSPLKDLVDSLASAVQLLPNCGSLARETASDADAILTYLRESGVPPRDIELRRRELAAEGAAMVGQDRYVPT